MVDWMVWKKVLTSAVTSADLMDDLMGAMKAE